MMIDDNLSNVACVDEYLVIVFEHEVSSAKPESLTFVACPIIFSIWRHKRMLCTASGDHSSRTRYALT